MAPRGGGRRIFTDATLFLSEVPQELEEFDVVLPVLLWHKPAPNRLLAFAFIFRSTSAQILVVLSET
jgi:hypothetical protein